MGLLQKNIDGLEFSPIGRRGVERRHGKTGGFTMVELLVAISVSSIILFATYGALQSLFNVVSASRAKIVATALINEQLEIIRNMPYASVGIVQGIPNGVLSHTQTLTRDGFVFTISTFVRNVDDPFDGVLAGSPNDTSPADYKSVEVDAACSNCKNFTPVEITTTVSPKNLETASTNGALFIKVFDSAGNPVPGASVHVQNNSFSPAIVIDDLTNNQGLLQLVSVPPANSSYEITVTKPGYSTDKTYSPTAGNPNPIVPNASVILQQITQVSFSIDKLSSFSVSSVSGSCTPVSNFNFTLRGAKNIGTNPLVSKYSQNKTTDSGGLLTIPNMEWDTYSFIDNDSTYDLIGVTPPSPVALGPDSSQNITLMLAPKNPQTLAVTVRDKATGLPLSGVLVELSKGSFDQVAMTGQGFLRQVDWYGGSGQATSTDETRYFSSDGNADTHGHQGSVFLRKANGNYVSNGWLISSSFDIGFPGTFQQVYWNPASQPSDTEVKMQIATNNDGGTWNFVGPDGTSDTYYTTSNQNIWTAGPSRFLRYKLFMSTTDSKDTPTVSEISFTFTSSCTPPGQVSFSGLSNGNNYKITLTKEGYNDQNIFTDISSSWQTVDVQMQED